MPFVHGIGWFELVIVLVIIMTFFGVGRLPEVGGAMGKAIREFRSSVSGKTEAEEKDKAEVEPEKSEKA